MVKFATFLEAFPGTEGDDIADRHFSGTFFDFYKPHDSFGIGNFEPSLTRQSEAEDCDINVIMARFESSGTLPILHSTPTYVDYSNVPDLMEALNLMNAAQASFEALPARVRREFDNDPAQFVEFAQDPQNLDQMRAWGLAAPAKQEAPKVPPASPKEPEKAPDTISPSV